jgi:hypothetical protein
MSHNFNNPEIIRRLKLDFSEAKSGLGNSQTYRGQINAFRLALDMASAKLILCVGRTFLIVASSGQPRQGARTMKLRGSSPAVIQSKIIRLDKGGSSCLC